MRSLESPITRQLIVPLLLVATVLILGTAGFAILGGGRWSLTDCAFMTVITLTTVGYGDVLGVIQSPLAEFYTMALMLVGMGVTLYAVSAITAFVVERHLTHLFEARKMQKQIDKLQNHFILCGGGTTGEHIIEEFRTTRQSFVLIERDEENLGLLRERFPNLLGIRGNAMNEEVLQRAGIERAAGLVAALHTDSENMFVTVRARFLHPSLKIVAKCVDHGSADLFSAAGATYVVSPNFIGGMRMASEMIRPHVVSFLDRMLRGQDQTVRVSEVTVGEGARIAGQTIGEADLFGKVGLNVIATCTAGSDEFAYNPPPDLVLDPGRVLLVIGNVDQVAKLKSLAGAA